MRRRNIRQSVVATTTIPLTGLVGHYIGQNYNFTSGSWLCDKTTNHLTVPIGYTKPNKIGNDTDFNNKDSLEFQNGMLLSIASNILTSNGTDNTVFVVTNFINTNGYHILGENKSTATANEHWNILRFESNQYIYQQRALPYNTRDARSGTPTNTKQLLCGSINGNTSIIRKNGVELTSNTSSLNGSFSADRLDVGGIRYNQVPTTLYLNGKIAEIVLYNRALDNTELNLVESYLNTKYGIY
jgi:hypothetical protein